MSGMEFFIYLLVMAGSTYLIRALPFALLDKKIKSQFIRSFLYYIPYTVLAAMTFPAALYVTGSMLSAAVGLAVAVVVSINSESLTLVALSACVSVCLCEWILLLV